MFADSLGWARHIVVDSDGDVFVAIRGTGGAAWTTTWRSGPSTPGGIVVLRDRDRDGKADETGRVGGSALEGDGVTGLALSGDSLFFATDTSVHVLDVSGAALTPDREPARLIGGFPPQAFHGAKSLVLDGVGGLLVNVGAPSNSCQVEDRGLRSPGQDPCSELELQAGIWRFSTARTGQRHGRDGTRYATGVRNALAMDWHAGTSSLFAVLHGRDQLDESWPELFTPSENSRLPAEELHRIESDAVLAWPNCYWDPTVEAYVTMPEYGGDGRSHTGCERYRPPAVAFAAHWAPNDMVFYDAPAFSQEFRSGAFVAFHGSWNRSPTQEGYQVAFVPFSESGPTGEWRSFATGFAGPEPIPTRDEARFRPTGVAVGPDGALYVADSVVGRIWRITYGPEPSENPSGG